jgi:L-lysine 2,3-aminomutase
MQQQKLANWQQELINVITDPSELLHLLGLDICWLEPAKAAAKQFPLKVPHSFLSRIKKGDINDPLLRQILPLGIELNESEGFTLDPLKEADANPIPGLLHKYRSRVLLTLTGACGIHCRYCFRRHFPYENNNPGTHGWESALQYIENRLEINEVILSGGDPLVVSDALLQTFSEKLAKIPQIKRLRIHSRLPIVIPSRITPQFVEWATHAPFNIILVVHVNHPQEIDDTVKTAMDLFKKPNITLLNQTVLLKGVNDDADTLVELSETLFSAGILPYYLHILDKVQGAAHFDIKHETACDLHRNMTEQLPGFLVPKLVCEQPGQPAKMLVS